MSSTTDGWFMEADSRDWPEGDLSTTTVLDSLVDVFYVVDRRGRFVEWNEEFRRTTGYTDEEIAGFHQFDIIPDEKESEARELLAAVADGERVTLEAPLVTADGTEIAHEFTASPLADDDGEVWGMAGTARDVSERRRREDLLRELHTASRRLMRAQTTAEVADRAAEVVHEHLNYATVGVRVLVDDRLELVSLATKNDRPDRTPPPYEVGEGFIGEVYARGEAVVIDDMAAVDPPIDYDPIRSAMLLPIPGQGMLSVGATEPGAFDEADIELGRLFVADVESALERADREERLRERKRDLERYETLVETMSDGVYASDEANRVSMVNDAMADLLGRDRADLLGTSMEAFGRLTDAEKVAYRQQLLESDDDVVRIEDVLERPDGEPVHVENRFSLLPGDGFEGTVGVVRDVTERKEREDLLRDIHDTARGLMTAKTKAEVARRTAAVAEGLGFSTLGVRLLDDAGRLEVVAQSSIDEFTDTREFPAYEPGEGFVGETYAAGQPVVCNDLREVDLGYDPSPVRSALFIPIEGYGMLSVGALEPGGFDETDVELGRLFATDVEAALERADREERLRERKRDLERYETLVETMSDGVYMTDADHRITAVNDAMVDMLGYGRDTIVGADLSIAGDDAAVEEGTRAREHLVSDDESVLVHETELTTADGERVPVENRFSLLPGDGFEGTVGVVRDVTDRVERERALQQSRERYRTLVEHFPDGTVFLFDEDCRYLLAGGQELEHLGLTSEDLVGNTPDEVFPPDVAAEVNASYEPALEGETYTTEQVFQGNRYRVRTMPVRNTEGDVEVGMGVARNITEQHEYQVELKARRDELARLNRINELIQEAIHALASAATRGEIEQVVCERLVDSEFYSFAWTGETTHSDGVVTPRTSAGGYEAYRDGIDISFGDGGDSGPATRAVRTGEVQVCQDISSDTGFQPWREAALAEGFRSIAVVPFRHGETVHGVLLIYAGSTDAFGQRELRALEVLGDMVGFAISATQNRQLIHGDTVQELELRIAGDGTVLGDLATRLDCTCRVRGLAATADDGMVHYVTVEGATSDEVRDAVDGADGFDRLADFRTIRDEADACLVEARVVDSVPEVVQESGVETVDMVAEAGHLDVHGRGPQDLDTRTLLDTLESTHGDAELVAKRDVSPPARPTERSDGTVRDRLTDRQVSALNAAYFGGYFDWPRDSTAEDVAEALGITSATLHQHLRHAQRKLLEACFVDDSRRDLDT